MLRRSLHGSPALLQEALPELPEKCSDLPGMFRHRGQRLPGVPGGQGGPCRAAGWHLLRLRAWLLICKIQLFIPTSSDKCISNLSGEHLEAMLQRPSSLTRGRAQPGKPAGREHVLASRVGGSRAMLGASSWQSHHGGCLYTLSLMLVRSPGTVGPRAVPALLCPVPAVLMPSPASSHGACRTVTVTPADGVGAPVH